MIWTSIILLLLAAVFGLYMASRVFSDILPPWGAVILHGLLAAAGLLVLLYALYVGMQAAPLAVGAVLLVIAALGGFFMFGYQLRNLTPPKGIVVVHALLAVLGVLSLLGSALGLV
jgi:hypothetical protein